MTHDEHREHHKMLHRRFDELLADWIDHTGKLPSKHSVLEFMEWSHTQTIEPDEK